MYTLANTQTNTIAIPCRSCGKLYEVSLSNFTRANKYTVGIACAACGDKFSVRVPPLKRGGPTPHAPDKSGDSVTQAKPVKSSNPPVESAPFQPLLPVM